MKNFLFLSFAGLIIVFLGMVSVQFLREQRAEAQGGGEPAVIQTHHDKIPNFCRNATVVSIRSGSWSDVSIWSSGHVPISSDIVRVEAGHTVTVNQNIFVSCLGIHGTVRVDTTADRTLTAGNYLIYSDGAFEAGTKSNPVPANRKVEIVIADKALDTVDDGTGVFDPSQFGTAFLALGRVTMHGAVKAPTFARLGQEPKKGDATLVLSDPIGVCGQFACIPDWRAGDRLILPDSRQLDWNERGSAPEYPYNPQWEEFQIASISPDGRTVTLTAPLKFDHPGARNADGVLEFLPHVGNLTRNVTVRSENPDGTRGHTLFTHRADVDIRYVTFKDLGRTKWNPDLDSTTFDAQGKVMHIGANQIARYPLHMHHAIGPVNPANTGYQFQLVGNAIDGGSAAHAFRWGIVVHASHYGLVKDNVVYNEGGGGIVAEDGSESYNLFDHNFVMRVLGTGGRMDNGRDGAGFWFRGPNNIVRDNIATNINAGGTYSYGFNIWAQGAGNARVPKYRGADLTVEGQYSVLDLNAVTIPEFARNEVYGATPNGLTLWWVGAEYRTPKGVAGVIKDFRVWHHYQWGYFGYETNDLTIDGFVARGDTRLAPENRNTGMWFGDYWQKGLEIVHADIQGMGTGILLPLVADGETLVADSYLRNGANIVVTTMASVNGSSGLPAKSARIRNVKFDAPVGLPLRSIYMAYSTIGAGTGGFPTNLVQKDEVFVEDYNQALGVNFQVFYKAQRPDFVVPETGSNTSASTLIGAPRGDIGLTNAQLVAKYPDGATIEGQYYRTVAIAGAIAPCMPGDVTKCPNALNSPENDPTGKYAGIVGDIFPLSTPPPRTNRAPSVSAGADQTITLYNNASLDATVSDDNLPDPPKKVTLIWSKVSGSGTVTFDKPDKLKTDVSFSTDGAYILRLTADDSEKTATDDIKITVQPIGTKSLLLTITSDFRDDKKLDQDFSKVRVKIIEELTGNVVLNKIYSSNNGGEIVVLEADLTNIKDDKTIEYRLITKIIGHVATSLNNKKDLFSDKNGFKFKKAFVGDFNEDGKVDRYDINILITYFKTKDAGIPKEIFKQKRPSLIWLIKTIFYSRNKIEDEE